jgi:hypothetical protein
MSVYTITPDVTYPAVLQETTLDGTTYRLTFRYNERDGYWYLTIADVDDVVIKPSVRLVAGARFLRYIVQDTRPGGELIVLSTPDRDSLGSSDPVIYLDATEVAALS